MEARLDLWNIGKLAELVGKAKNLNKPPSCKSKSRRATRRAARLLHENKFAWVAQMAGSLRIAEANEATIRALSPLFLARGEVSEAYLLAYYGPQAAPLQDPPPSTVTLYMLRECLAAIPPISTPHKDKWRNEHL